MAHKATHWCGLALWAWLVIMAHYLDLAAGQEPQAQVCTTWEVVTDPPRPVGDSTDWLFFFRCKTPSNIVPAGYSNDTAICYRNTFPDTCGGGSPFRRDTYTLAKLARVPDARSTNFVPSPQLPVERLSALFGTNSWGIRSNDGACTYEFAVAPLPNGGTAACPDASDEGCVCREGRSVDSSDWTDVGPVTLRPQDGAGTTTFAISPKNQSLSAFVGNTQPFQITIDNPLRPCTQLPPPEFTVDGAIPRCDAPPAEEYGWYAPNAADNTCELTITCSWLSEGTTTVKISVLPWSGSTPLAFQETLVTVVGSKFTISPSGASLSRITGTSQTFNILVTNRAGECADLPAPTVVVQSPGPSTSPNTCTVPNSYSGGLDGTSCSLEIACTMRSTTGITINATDWNNKVVATQSTTVSVCAAFTSSGTYTVRGGTALNGWNCTTCSRDVTNPASRSISCSNCFQRVNGLETGPVTGSFTYDVPCNCPSNGVQFQANATLAAGGRLICPINQCVWQLVTDPPLPAVGKDYLMALRCAQGDVFASGLSTSQPICYRIGSDPYRLTSPNLTSAATSLTLAVTPTGNSAASRLTGFTGSSNAWVALVSAPDSIERAGVPVRVARANLVDGTFSCPELGGPEFAATPTLTVTSKSQLFDSIRTVSNNNANASAPGQRISIPVSITAPAAICAQLADPQLSVEPVGQGVATCASNGVFRAVAPAQSNSNGGSCALSTSINCTSSRLGSATLTIRLSGAGAWTNPSLAPVTVNINVCHQLTNANYRHQCSGCRFVDRHTKRKLICTQCCEEVMEGTTKVTKCDIPAGQPFLVPCTCTNVAYTYDADTGGTLACL